MLHKLIVPLLLLILSSGGFGFPVPEFGFEQRGSVLDQFEDVVNGDRDLEISGNPFDGSFSVETSHTHGEIAAYVFLGVGIVLITVCFGVFCKYCCSKGSPTVRPLPPTTINVYQRMTPPGRNNQSINANPNASNTPTAQMLLQSIRPPPQQQVSPYQAATYNKESAQGKQEDQSGFDMPPSYSSAMSQETGKNPS